MPLNPVSIENPYGLPPLNSEEDDPIARLQREYAEEQGDPNLQMQRSIAENAQRPGADQGALGRALSAAAIAVPMSEWKPAPEPLPVSKKDLVRTVLASRERQLRSLETFASDPKNPVSQEEVGRIRDQIESEAQRALSQSTLPSPVSMYETLVEDENPEVKRAKVRDSWKSIPGFKEEWGSFVSFDPETNEPVYPKWMEKPLEAALGKAMGVGGEEGPTQAVKDAEAFARHELEAQRPKAKDFGENTAAYEEAKRQYDLKMKAHLKRYNPAAYAQLPTFAEESGQTEMGVAPGAAPQPAPPAAAGEPAPARQFNILPPEQFRADETEQLQNRFLAGETNAVVVRSGEEFSQQLASGEIGPDDVVVVSTSDGAVAFKLQSDGQLRVVGRYANRQ